MKNTFRLIFSTAMMLIITTIVSPTILKACDIWEVQADVMPCNNAGMFWVLLDFEFENAGNEGFRVLGNGINYGNFWYENLPIEIGPLAGDGVSVYEFVVIDNQYQDCSAWTAIDPVSCGGGSDCFIGELIIDDHPCNDEGYFYAMLNFEYENVSDAGFNVYANDQYLGTFNYDELPFDVGPLLGDGETVYNFLVVDAVYVACCNWRAIDPVSCGDVGDCVIGQIIKEIEPCNEAGNFFVLLNFEYANVSDEGFSVFVNDSHFGNFNYGNLPIEIGPLDGDGVTSYSFWINDLVYNYCHNSTAIEPVSCDGNNCNIWDLQGAVLPCNDQGNFFVLLDFEYENVGEQGFALYINDDFIGNREYGALPIEVGPLVGNGTTEYVISVSDNVFDDCGGQLTIEPVACDSDNIFIGDEQIIIYPNPSNGTLNLKFREGLATPLTLVIYNLKGEEIYNAENINTEEYEVSLPKNGGGLYFYKIINTSGEYKGKIVVN